jgi:hypothetical protein
MPSALPDLVLLDFSALPDPLLDLADGNDDDDEGDGGDGRGGNSSSAAGIAAVGRDRSKSCRVR